MKLLISAISKVPSEINYSEDCADVIKSVASVLSRTKFVIDILASMAALLFGVFNSMMQFLYIQYVYWIWILANLNVVFIEGLTLSSYITCNTE